MRGEALGMGKKWASSDNIGYSLVSRELQFFAIKLAAPNTARAACLLSFQSAMASPHHISGSACRLLTGNKASAEYRALSIIAESLAHPQRTLLSTFVQQAVDPELASRFFLDEITKITVLEFLAEW